MSSLIERARRLEAGGTFLGGPIETFATAGRGQLIALLSEGLTPGSKVLDVGCGCLRGGYWLLHFLDAARYFGIEPNKGMLQAGLDILLEQGLADAKRPTFDHNAEFDFTVFGTRFDFVVARSIWTHASKIQIRAMLESFAETAEDSGILLSSYIRPTLTRRDYKGTQWVGVSHESDSRGMVSHSLGWIQDECRTRSLVAEEKGEDAYDFSSQRWLRIKRRTRC